MIQDHWNKRSIDFVAFHLANARQLVRVATGFFTVQGYDLIRQFLIGKRVQILVGFDETSKERLREKLIDDIMLHLSLWDAPNRREAVLDLVGKLQRGELQIIELRSTEIIEARIRKQDHAKIFIIDEDCVLVGSSNLTLSGLHHNVEGLGSITDPERVAYWVQQFQTYWTAPDTYDLTRALLEALLAWLELRLPYDVYLKTIQALVPEDDAEPPRDTYKMPVKYQMVVIARVLRQLKEWRGAMLVASTGLGKTVMATHVAYCLQRENKTRNVIVFAPLQVQPDWEYALDSAGLSYKIFTRNLLDQPLSKNRRNREVRRILDALDRVDDQYIIVVDESQHFKNQLRAKDGSPRFSFRRLSEATRKKKPYVVLLTATPLSKGVEDLNNQLHLLPHSAEPSYINVKGQHVMPGIGDHLVSPKAWRVRETEGFFEEFMNLPVCTVISTSQVAKNFAEHTPEGDYIQFPHERRWIPQIEVKRIKVPVLFERQMSQAISHGYFKHKMFSFQNRGVWQRSESTIQNHAEVAWTSSPLALREVLEDTLDGTYEVEFIRTLEERATILKPILDRLIALPYQQDEKFMTLCKYLRQFREQGQKVVVFTERLATAVYLERNLAEAMPELRVANAVEETKQGYQLKEFDDVFELILGFAPEANADKIVEGSKPEGYDVFISTDAYGAGVNLQDATVVISYDLAWTADIIIQRAGRILRFWKEPRRVYLYVFVGDFREDAEGISKTKGVEKRLRELTRRSHQAEKFSELPVFTETESAEYISLSDLSSVTIADLGLADISQIEEFTGVSRFLKHITELNQNLDRAEAIPDDISSAMVYGGEVHQLYLLLRYKQDYHWMLYDIQSKTLSGPSEDRLLDLIQCTPDTPIANVAPGIIEEQAQQCRKLWARQNEVDQLDEVERICALYLLPQKDSAGFDSVLRSGLT